MIGPHERRLAGCFVAAVHRDNVLSVNHDFEHVMGEYQRIASTAIDEQLQHESHLSREEIAEKILSEI